MAAYRLYNEFLKQKNYLLDWICGWKTSIYESSQSKHADFCLIIDAQKQFYGNKFIIHIEQIDNCVPIGIFGKNFTYGFLDSADF